MNVAFVHIPKAAGGSVYTWLRNHKDEYNFKINKPGHLLLSEIKEENDINFDFSFTVTRNTYSRLISLYIFTGWKNLKKLTKSIQRNNQIAINEFQEKMDIHNKGICYFLDWAIENAPTMTRSQLEWIQGVDTVLKQENLTEDFKIIQDKLGCYVSLPTWGHKMNYNPQEYYTGDFKKLVAKHYAEELEFFKYMPKY